MLFIVSYNGYADSETLQFVCYKLRSWVTEKKKKINESYKTVRVTWFGLSKSPGAEMILKRCL